MLREVIARLGQGYRTQAYPAAEPALPKRFRGRPVLAAGACPSECSSCAQACPTAAVHATDGSLAIDLGKCLFCGDCAAACPDQRIEFTREYRMAVADRDGLWVRSAQASALGVALRAEARRLFGRSLKLRQVSAGGCNACEADVNVLGTLAFDMGRFGIEFVASPRHADGLLLTGPVPQNMALALKKTWDATPGPKVVIAVGACAISGGPYAGNAQVRDGGAGILPIDLYVPGCPPHPYTVLDGLLRFLGRIAEPSAHVRP